MDEARGVRGVERGGDRGEQAQRAAGIELAVLDEVLQRAAADVAHREVEAVVSDSPAS